MEKKIISLVMTLVAFVGSSLHAAQSDRVTVVPISYDAGEWKILLGHNVQTGYWECFSDTRQNPSESNASVAQRVLHNQMVSVYDVFPQDYKFMVNYQGSVTIFIKVPFVGGKNLFEQARNKYVDNFKWVTASDLGQAGDVKFFQANVHRGVLKNLRINFAKVVADINRRLLPARGAGPAVVTPQDSTGIHQLPPLPLHPPGSYYAGNPVIDPIYPQTSPISHQGLRQFPPRQHQNNVPVAVNISSRRGVQQTQQNFSHQQNGRWSQGNFPKGQVAYFYDNDKPYYEFTNFYDRASFRLNGDIWKTSEHYFQAQKFVKGSVQYNAVRDASTARAVFTLANGRNGTYKSQIRSDWHSIKQQVMKDGLIAKFTQNKYVADLLRDTDIATLVEDAGANDVIWGAGQDMNGQNKLGLLLMEIRGELNQGWHGGWPT